MANLADQNWGVSVSAISGTEKVAPATVAASQACQKQARSRTRWLATR